MRAEIHWTRLFRPTHTAVAPWSCIFLCITKNLKSAEATQRLSIKWLLVFGRQFQCTSVLVFCGPAGGYLRLMLCRGRRAYEKQSARRRRTQYERIHTGIMTSCADGGRALELLFCSLSSRNHRTPLFSNQMFINILLHSVSVSFSARVRARHFVVSRIRRPHTTHRWTVRNCTSFRAIWKLSQVPEESIRFSSHGRLLHIPSLARTAAWDERCSGVEERCALSLPGSAEEEQAPAMLGSPAASRRSSSFALHEHQSHPSAVTPTRAVTLKSDVAPRQPLDLAEVLAKLDEPKNSQSLEKEFGGDMALHTRHGGASRSDDFSQEIRELGAPPRGVSSAPLWSSPKLAMGHRDGHRRRRRGQNRRIRTPPRDTLSDLRDARVCSKVQLFGLSDPDARPDVHWPPAEVSRSRQQSRKEGGRTIQRRRETAAPPKEGGAHGPKEATVTISMAQRNKVLERVRKNKRQNSHRQGLQRPSPRERRSNEPRQTGRSGDPNHFNTCAKDRQNYDEMNPPHTMAPLCVAIGVGTFRGGVQGCLRGVRDGLGVGGVRQESGLRVA